MGRITKKVVAQTINDFFERVEMPYEVDAKNIERSYFTQDQYEAGATCHHITAYHKTNTNNVPLSIYTMQGFKSMQNEIAEKEGRFLTVKNYGRNQMLDLWVVVDG